MRSSLSSRRPRRLLSIALALGLAATWFPGCGASAPPPPNTAQAAAIIQEEVHVPTAAANAKRR